MKIVAPKAFTFGNGKRAVLLLHGFTGNTADVRMLARYLEKRGYTCHAPLFKGHGVPPEQLLTTGPHDWWEDVMNGYTFLQEKGHKEIAVAGLSLGGVFSLKIGYTVPIKGIVPMCAPAYLKSEEVMYQGILEYAEKYKRHEEKTDQQIETEMEDFKKIKTDIMKELQTLFTEVRDHLDMIYAPLFAVQARHDHMINPDSANIIYKTIESVHKEIKWYEESGHVITLDKEKDLLHEDVYQFLEKLDWEE